MDDLVRIVTTGSGTGIGTRVYMPDGAEVRYVTGIDVRLRADEFATATITLIAGASDITAHPLLSRETLEASAAALGMKLVQADGADPQPPAPDGALGWFWVDPAGICWIGTLSLSRQSVTWRGPFLPRDAQEDSSAETTGGGAA